jgi:hypothetical protein
MKQIPVLFQHLYLGSVGYWGFVYIFCLYDADVHNFHMPYKMELSFRRLLCSFSLVILVLWEQPFLIGKCVLSPSLVLAPRRNRTTTALFSTVIFLLLYRPNAIWTERLYLRRCLNILCGITLNNKQSCRLINKNRAIFIVCLWSLTYQIFGLLKYTMKIARFFLKTTMFVIA